MRDIKHRSNESEIAMIILCAATVAAIVFCVILLFTAKVHTIHITGGSLNFTIDEDQYPLSAEPLVCDNVIYIPAADVLAQCGYEIGWDSEKNAMLLSNEDGKSYIFLNSNIASYVGNTAAYNNNTFSRHEVMYMPIDMFYQFSEDELVADGEFKVYKIPFRDTMEDTFINDDYRIAEEPVMYNNIYVMNSGVAMEMVAYPEENCRLYAEIVNRLAATLPDVKVYDELIPSMSEFYGPRKIYTDQLTGMKRIYQQLGGNIMTVNAVKEMWAHAGEKLYFNTDHHWTQRGAYYAYKALMEAKGEDVPSLESFAQQNINDFTGSWVRTLNGTAGQGILEAHPEVMERFMPNVQCTGDVYSDMYMTQHSFASQVINVNDRTYSTFIMGDQPLTKYVTQAGTGQKAVLLKESYGDAFATWLVNNYDEVYIIDPRYWNGVGGHYNPMKLASFYQTVGGFDDLIILSSPGSAAKDFRNALSALMD